MLTSSAALATVLIVANVMLLIGPGGCYEIKDFDLAVMDGKGAPAPNLPTTSFGTGPVGAASHMLTRYLPRMEGAENNIDVLKFVYKPGYDEADVTNPFQLSDYEFDPLSMMNDEDQAFLVQVNTNYVPPPKSLPSITWLREHSLTRSLSRLTVVLGLFISVVAYRYIRLAGFVCNLISVVLMRAEMIGWQYRYKMLIKLAFIDNAFIGKAAFGAAVLAFFSIASGMPGNATFASIAIVYMITGWWKTAFSVEQRLGLMLTLPLCLAPLGFGLRQAIAPLFFGVAGPFLLMFGLDMLLDTGFWRDIMCAGLYHSVDCRSDDSINRAWEPHFRIATLVLMILCSYAQFYIVWGLAKRIPSRRLPYVN